MRKTTLIGLALLSVLSLPGCNAMLASMDEAFACSDPLSIDCTVARQKGNAARAEQERYERDLEAYEECWARQSEGEDVDCSYYEPQPPVITSY